MEDLGNDGWGSRWCGVVWCDMVGGGDVEGDGYAGCCAYMRWKTVSNDIYAGKRLESAGAALQFLRGRYESSHFYAIRFNF